MRRDRFAGRLLESVTTTKRAAALLGDLRESAGARGEVWFWSNLLRTTGSLAWTGMLAAPRPIFSMAFCGLLLTLIGEFCLLGALAVIELSYALWRSASSGVGAVAGGVVWNGAWTGGWSGLALTMTTQFLVGRWIARRTPGRAFAACLALSLLQLTVVSLMAVAFGSSLRSEIPLSLALDFFYFLGALMGAQGRAVAT